LFVIRNDFQDKKAFFFSNIEVQYICVFEQKPHLEY